MRLMKSADKENAQNEIIKISALGEYGERQKFTSISANIRPK